MISILKVDLRKIKTARKKKCFLLKIIVNLYHHVLILRTKKFCWLSPT